VNKFVSNNAIKIKSDLLSGLFHMHYPPKGEKKNNNKAAPIEMHYLPEID